MGDWGANSWTKRRTKSILGAKIVGLQLFSEVSLFSTTTEFCSSLFATTVDRYRKLAKQKISIINPEIAAK